MTAFRTRSNAPGLLVVLSVLLGGSAFAVLAGAATALFGAYAAAMFAAIVVGLTALFIPIHWLIIILLVVTFLIAGQLIYFARLPKALWLPYLVGALIWVRYPLDRLHYSTVLVDAPLAPRSVRVLIGLYFTTLAASTLFNLIEPLQILVSLKEYLFLWSLYLVLATGLVKASFVVRLWALLPWLMLLQLPLIVYQRFVVAKSREGFGAAWDSVVGAFGGNPQSGGASGAMGLFCVIAMVTVVAQWRRGLMRGWQTLLLSISGMIGIGLAEVKFAVLLLPVGFMLLFRRQFLRRPIQGMLALCLSLLLSFGLLEGYRAQYDTGRDRQTFGQYFEGMFAGSADSDFVNLQTREIGRVASVKFWASRHGINEPLQLLIGHGIGASRIGDMVVGEAAKRHPFNIGRSALVVLLWEAGLIGALTMIGILSFAYVKLYRSSLDERLDAGEVATTESMAVAVVIIMASLPYNTDLVGGSHILVLLLLCLGWLAMINGKLRPATRPLTSQTWRNAIPS